jgi:FAD/FMN-containing dehydrogenase
MTDTPAHPAIDWADVARALAPVGLIDEPVLVRKRARDFFWYSPLLDRRLKTCFGDLVARPDSVAQMRHVLSTAARMGVPLVMRGGGTGNYGQCVPMEGGLIVETEGLNRVLEIGPDTVRVEAGCNIAALNAALAEHGR